MDDYKIDVKPALTCTIITDISSIETRYAPRYSSTVSILTQEEMLQICSKICKRPVTWVSTYSFSSRGYSIQIGYHRPYLRFFKRKVPLFHFTTNTTSYEEFLEYLIAKVHEINEDKKRQCRAADKLRGLYLQS